MDDYSNYYLPTSMYKIVYATDELILEDDYYAEYCDSYKQMCRRCCHLQEKGVIELDMNGKYINSPVQILGFRLRTNPMKKFSELLPWSDFNLKRYKQSLIDEIKRKNTPKELISLFDLEKL